MNLVQYIKDSFQELNNISWMSKEESQRTTIMVAVFTIVFALGVAALDYVFQYGLDEFFKRF